MEPERSDLFNLFSFGLTATRAGELCRRGQEKVKILITSAKGGAQRACAINPPKCDAHHTPAESPARSSWNLPVPAELTVGLLVSEQQFGFGMGFQ
jgi:hypothetical protein